jgi:hypothetical protein
MLHSPAHGGRRRIAAPVAARCTPRRSAVGARRGRAHRGSIGRGRSPHTVLPGRA